MENARARGFTALACLLLAALLVLFCSQSSPLYPINLWDDANCLLTVGRVMRAGGVLYRDIYEQKGPTLYLAHMLAACVSDGGFFGVYLVETLCLAAALYFAARTLRARLSPAASVAVSALGYALLLVSPAFSRGDSAEEFCLPFLSAAVYLAFSAYEGGAPMRPRRMFVCGLLAGAVATVKYTALGFFLGLCALEGALALRAGGMRRALVSAAAFLGGMALPILAWCAYFAANGALGDFFTAYVVNNIFLYDGGAAEGRLVPALRLARDNALWLLPLALGAMLFMLRRKNGALRPLAAALLAGTAAGALAGRLWAYCLLPLGALWPVGATGLLDAAERVRERMSAAMRRALCGACVALALLCAWFLSPNAFLRFVPLSDLAQGRLAARIPEGASLLQYSHLDDGLYLTSGALPQERFFVRLNVNYKEMIEALDGYVERGEPDYVLVSWRELPERFDRYALVAADTAYDDAGRLNKALYLYERKGK